MTPRSIGLWLVLTLAACGNHRVDVENYDRSCADASGCVAVITGDLCNPRCACPNTAISTSAKPKYDADATALGQCGPPQVSCGRCDPPKVACVDATCIVE